MCKMVECQSFIGYILHKLLHLISPEVEYLFYLTNLESLACRILDVFQQSFINVLLFQAVDVLNRTVLH